MLSVVRYYEQKIKSSSKYILYWIKIQLQEKTINCRIQRKLRFSEKYKKQMVDKTNGW